MMILSSVLVTALSLISSTESFSPRSIVSDRLATSGNHRVGPLSVSLVNPIIGTQPQETTVAAVPKVRRRDLCLHRASLLINYH
ncbi:MAG: hypothetical protein ACI8RD_011805 [Bacillariaceae sp.]|jgi:hypothetical protein